MPRHTPNSRRGCRSCPTALGACSHLQAAQGPVLRGSTRTAQPSWHGRTPAPGCPFSLESSFSKSDLFHLWFPRNSYSNHPRARDYACHRGHGITCPFQKVGWTGHGATAVRTRWSCHHAQHAALRPWGQAGPQGTTWWPSAHLQSGRTQTPAVSPWSSLLSRTQGPSPLSLAASLPAPGRSIAPSDPALSGRSAEKSHSPC